MSDSDNDIANPNVFTFQNGNTSLAARGPKTNINFSFQNQFTSTMCMPRNFGRQRYAESVSDQRSLYYRRETSPMSIHSACDIQSRNFQPNYRGMGSHRSGFNGRSGSPMSIRSIDSSASVSAADIAFAFKNVKFNKYDLRVIKEAYNKLMKQRARKRIEKRRNMKLFLKGSRNRSGDDSGEQGSDSSISSDDCRSVKTSYKENMSSTRLARIDFNDFRNPIRDNNNIMDCSENIEQGSFKNMFSVSSSNFNRNQSLMNSSVAKQGPAIITQKERFRNGFLLPSQRFNRSVASTVIPENSDKYLPTGSTNKQRDKRNCGSGSEEEIFSKDTTQRQHIYNNNDPQQKRKSLDSDDDDSSLPNKKKSKLSTPTKNSQSNIKNVAKTYNNSFSSNINNFEFAKPTLPVRKSKPKIQEKILAKSKPPLTDFEEMPETINIVKPAPATCNQEDIDNQSHMSQSESTLNSDVSMRPSFIKRKLFTQKLDVAEKANLSREAINSPQGVYSKLQKEKNKARKLVTTQSCLNRVIQEDNNLLDLIHKIVPAECMNITNQTTIHETKTDAHVTNKDDEDKWDVTSVISMCNDNDASDTYTDDEIFENDSVNKGNLKKKKGLINNKETNGAQKSLNCAKQDNKKNTTDTKETSSTNQEIKISTCTKPKAIKNPKVNDSNLYLNNKKKDDMKNIKGNTVNCNNKKIKKGLNICPKEDQILKDRVNVPQPCTVVIEKIPSVQEMHKLNSSLVAHCNLSKSNLKTSAKTFWDTDFESDVETQITEKKSFGRENVTNHTRVEPSRQEVDKFPVPGSQNVLPKNHIEKPETSKWLHNKNNTTLLNNTINTTLSLRSHRTLKKTKCCDDAPFQQLANKKCTIQKSVRNTKKANASEDAKQKKNPMSTSKNPVSKKETKDLQNSRQLNKSLLDSTLDNSSGFNISPLSLRSHGISKKNSGGNDTTLQQTPKAENKKPKAKAPKAVQKNIISNQTPKSDRPIRKCRTPSQNISFNNYKSAVRKR